MTIYMLITADNEHIDITEYIVHIIYKFGGANTVKLILDNPPPYPLINNKLYSILADGCTGSTYTIVAVELI